MRRLYTLLLYLLLPALSLQVLLRGLRQRDYWRGGGARFGFGSRRRPGGLWVHAVSVGEAQAAAILIGALRARHPDLEITLTCATPTGRARAAGLLPDIDTRYAPYDLPGSLRRAFERLQPRRLVVMETELWPNLLAAAHRRGVPTLIASARISERTARFYQRRPGLLRAALAANVWVGAQTPADAGRYASLGVRAERLQVVGNIKFDRAVPVDLAARAAATRAHYARGRPVWIAGSTHPGEEAIVLDAHRQILSAAPRTLLVLAPRHPPRFDAAADTIAAQGLRYTRRSRPEADPDAQVLLLDTLGELNEFYAAADVAFVGGSLVPIGGHNLLEPAALGIPVIAGPAVFNSAESARTLTAAGALSTVRDAAGLAAAVLRLLDDPAARAAEGAAARAAVEANRGALERLLQMIETLP